MSRLWVSDPPVRGSASAKVGRRARRELVAANMLLATMLVLHALDHELRQEAAVPAGTATAGTVGFVAVLAALVLALRGSRLAPIATAAVGLAIAAGFVAAHVLPEWSALSQPYGDIDVDALSWIAMLLPMLVGAGVGLASLRRLRGPV